MDPREDEKRAAAEAAALEVQDGTTLGLGTGSTVAHFLPALAARKLQVMCVATSKATEDLAYALGLSLQPFDVIDRLDLAVDGADQVAPDLWLVKGGGGAHTREKVVADAAERFVVIVSQDKLVDRLGPPVPIEVLSFGMAATMRRLGEIGPVEVREAPRTPDGNVVVDLTGAVDDPAALAVVLDAIPGVVGHGLFPPQMVTEVIVGRADRTTERLVAR
jgi:ribose 5-phosphate isomerase A